MSKKINNSEDKIQHSNMRVGKTGIFSPNPLHQRIARILKTTESITIPFSDRYVPDHKELVVILKLIRSMGGIIVFATGVWDMFHIGHGDYIEKGKREARKLYPNAEYIIMVVGVDTDILTKNRKGPNRPIVPEDERCRVLRHLRSVDIITPQNKLNQLYSIIEPEVQIISTSTEDLPPGLRLVRQHCTHIVNLPPQAQTSTTARIRQLSFDGGIALLGKMKGKLTDLLEELQNELKQ